MPVKPDEIATLVEMFEASKWDELHVEIDGLHLFLSTNPDARLAHGSDPAPSAIISAARSAAVEPAAKPVHATEKPLAAKHEVGEIPSHWVAVKAPNLGTFYRAPKPGAAPFVDVGQGVDDSTELCLLEVMKLFTTVRAGMSGTIRRICVADSEMVEFDQALFYIEPA